MAVRLGELLLREKRVTPTQLQEALTLQRVNGGRLGATLVKLGYLKDEDVTEVLSRQFGVPAIDLRALELDSALVRLIPAETAAKYNVIPVSRTGNTLTLAMTDPTNVFAMDDIKFRTGLNIEPVVASDMAIRDAIAKYFSGGSSPTGPATSGGGKSLDLVNRALEDLNVDSNHDELQVVEGSEEIDAASLERQGGEAPIIRLVNALFLSAIQKGASDIHVEPYEKDLRVRFRIDGVLQSVMTPPLKFRDPLVSRIKIMARLDIAEKRLPQDGRIKARFNDRGTSREIDFRVSVLPTLYGEKIVLRLLDAKGLRLDMTQLGFEPEALERFDRAIRKPWGMVLVTGPTGSGKTNTLYSALSQLNQPGVNIMTAEDPVEFNLNGINQVQVREQVGLTFAGALRSFLRQDPNIILVGEVRDAETAGIAVKAALTGHLVLSTLHTNDAPSSVSRLVNMGIEPFLVANSINLIAAQRLVRRVCENCKEPHDIPAAQLIEAGLPAAELPRVKAMRGRGCDRCVGTGYKGRLGLFEILEISESIRNMIVANAQVKEIRELAVQEGMSPLRQSGMLKVRDGLTTIEEVARETMQELIMSNALNLPDLLKATLELKGSDLHLSMGLPPQVRVDGHLKRLDLPELTPDGIKALAYSVLTDVQKKKFEETWELDLAFGLRGVGRFRCNVFNQKGSVGAVFRLIPEKIRPLDELGLPPVLAELADRPRGLVLVTGPTGSGKSTTLAAMVDRINLSKNAHILTIEDPIEYLHSHKTALVNQRELHADTQSFSHALRAALREDPDVVLVGELRDLETMEAALKLAETGHLTMATLHTNSAAQTITRLIDAFPAHQQSQIRTQLSLVLEGIVCQALLPKASGQGRVAALEILIATPAIRNLIRDDKIHQIYGTMQTGQEKLGMQTMNQALARLVERRIITRDAAINTSSHRDELHTILERAATATAAAGAPPAIRRVPMTQGAR